MLNYTGQQQLLLLIIYQTLFGELFTQHCMSSACPSFHPPLPTFSATAHMLALSPDLLLSGDRNHSSLLHVDLRLPLSSTACSIYGVPTSLFLFLSLSLSLSLWLSRPRAVHDHPDKGIKSGLDLYMSPRSLLAPNNRQPLPTRRGTLIIPKPPSVCLFMNPRLLMTMGPSSSLLLLHQRTN